VKLAAKLLLVRQSDASDRNELRKFCRGAGLNFGDDSTDVHLYVELKTQAITRMRLAGRDRTVNNL